MEADLKSVVDFVTSNNFITYVLNNTTDLMVAGFILQALLDIAEGKACLVKKEKLIKILADKLKLDALADCGVDNWGGYGEAWENLPEEFSDWEDYAEHIIEKGEF